METTVFTTPSGHKVTIKARPTYGDIRQIQRVFLNSAKIDPKNPGDTGFNAASMFDAQDLAVKLLVEKIVTKDGGEFAGESVLEVILSMDQQDGQAIYDNINELTELTGDTITPEKKGA